MPYKIKKSFEFSASHQLNGLPLQHPCSNLHGHNYVVTVEASADELDLFGFVVDYRDLDFVKEYIQKNLDHQHLNNWIVQPTAEYIAFKLYLEFKTVCNLITAVEVQETLKTIARYEP